MYVSTNAKDVVLGGGAGGTSVALRRVGVCDCRGARRGGGGGGGCDRLAERCGGRWFLKAKPEDRG